MRIIKLSAVFVLASLFLGSFLAAQNSSSAQNEGVRLFEQNKPVEAIAFLESDIASGTALPVEYNYLGLAYFQIGNYAKSAEAFAKGISAPGTNKKMLYFNMGNSYFAMGEYEKALEAFSMASVADPSYSAPLLNKANTEVKMDRLSDALSDYRRYLVLKPESEQRPKVENLISMIESEISDREERERIAAEEAARLKAEEERIAYEKAERARQEAERLAEEARLAEEKKRAEELLAAQKRAEEEERRRKMLEDVAASLREKAGTTNMSADAEKTLDYEYDSDF